jgi:hypothetical protein
MISHKALVRKELDERCAVRRFHKDGVHEVLSMNAKDDLAVLLSANCEMHRKEEMFTVDLAMAVMRSSHEVLSDTTRTSYPRLRPIFLNSLINSICFSSVKRNPTRPS